jgi:hypothetical protein
MSSQIAGGDAHSLRRRETFVDDVLAGHASLDDMDDYVDAWHGLSDDAPEASLELHEYLGLTWDEYRRWGTHPESLRFVLAAKRANLPEEDILAATEIVGAAARSNDSSDADRVLNWLAERGLIETEIRDI